MDQSWAPCPVKHEYGYLWWLNDDEIPWPGAPSTGRSARDNGGRHLLWVDPARELVLASHWTEDVLTLIRDVSSAVGVSNTWRRFSQNPLGGMTDFELLIWSGHLARITTQLGS